MCLKKAEPVTEVWGCSSQRLCAGWGNEPSTGLIWIDDSVVSFLGLRNDSSAVAKKGRAGSIGYQSAATSAMLGRSRFVAKVRSDMKILLWRRKYYSIQLLSLGRYTDSYTSSPLFSGCATCQFESLRTRLSQGAIQV